MLSMLYPKANPENFSMENWNWQGAAGYITPENFPVSSLGFLNWLSLYFIFQWLIFCLFFINQQAYLWTDIYCKNRGREGSRESLKTSILWIFCYLLTMGVGWNYDGGTNNSAVFNSDRIVTGWKGKIIKTYGTDGCPKKGNRSKA